MFSFFGTSMTLMKRLNPSFHQAMRKFTSQMIAGVTRNEGMYHFFQAKELALSLMRLPNANAKSKKKKVRFSQCLPKAGL
jgi:hypothetical protein